MWIIEQLGALIRSGNVPKSDEWIQSILDWLVIHGLFVVKKKSEKSPFPTVCSRLHTQSIVISYMSHSYALFPPPRFRTTYAKLAGLGYSVVLVT
jgi:DNA polymerase phi